MIGRRWNIDPVDRPWESPYAVNYNNPIRFIDPDGLFGWDVNSETGETTYDKKNDGKVRLDGKLVVDREGTNAIVAKDATMRDVVNLMKVLFPKVGLNTKDFESIQPTIGSRELVVDVFHEPTVVSRCWC